MMKFDFELGAKGVAMMIVAGLLSGCSTLPAFGPSSDVIVQAGTIVGRDSSEVFPFDIVNITSTSIPKALVPRRKFPDWLLKQSLLIENETIQVADVLEIRLWEVAEDGLFATSGERMTVLTANVSNSGEIEVPYAGRIETKGLSTSELRQVLIERYRGKAIEPEIIVRISETRSRDVTVLGAVERSGRTVVPPSGISLLNLLAQTGGVPYPLWEGLVSIRREGRSASLSLQEISDETLNNVVILPGDAVQVTHVPRRFSVYGAVSRRGNLEVPVLQPSLSKLLAEAGGLNDMLAEPNSVFVFRQPAPSQTTKQVNAIAYRLDFARPDAFLLADRFLLRSTDIVYVATADASEFRKFVTTILSPFFGAATNVDNLRN